MSRRRRGRLQVAAARSIAAYAGLSHYCNTVDGVRALGAVLALAPPLMIGGLLLRRWAKPLIAPVLAALALLLSRAGTCSKENSIGCVCCRTARCTVFWPSASRARCVPARPRCAPSWRTSCTDLDAARSALQPTGHRRMGVIFRRHRRDHGRSVRRGAAARVVAVHELLHPAAGGAHVHSRVCRQAPRRCRRPSAAAFWPRCGLFSPVHRRLAWRPNALLSHDSPTAVLAYREGGVIDAQQFLADAVRLAESSAARASTCSMSALDRYHFTVGLAACLISGQSQPLALHSHTGGRRGSSLQFAPDAFCLTDDARCDIELPRFYFPASTAERSAALRRMPGVCRRSPRPSSRRSCSPPDRRGRRCPTARPGDG